MCRGGKMSLEDVGNNPKPHCLPDLRFMVRGAVLLSDVTHGTNSSRIGLVRVTDRSTDAITDGITDGIAEVHHAYILYP